MIMIMNNIPDDDDAIFSNASFVPDLGPDALYIHVSIGISQIIVFNIFIFLLYWYYIYIQIQLVLLHNFNYNFNFKYKNTIPRTIVIIV